MKDGLERKSFRGLREKLAGKKPPWRGAGKDVYADPRNPRVNVVSVQRDWDPNQAERRILLSRHALNKVVNLLYPDTIPASSGISSRAGIQVRERIYRRHPFNWDSILTGLGLRISKKDDVIQNVIQKMLGLGLDADPASLNYITDKKGHTYYVDDLSAEWTPSDTATKIKVAIEKQLSGPENDSERKEALKWLERYLKFASTK